VNDRKEEQIKTKNLRLL
jgi:hypothetical protein